MVHGPFPAVAEAGDHRILQADGHFKATFIRDLRSVPVHELAHVTQEVTGGPHAKIESMSEYLVVIEHEGDAWGAYCPDLPGLGVAGESREEVERLIREAIPFHLEGLQRSGDPIPAPSAVSSPHVHVPAA